MSEDYPPSRIFFNILGGSLTLLSVQLPWMTIYGTYPISVQSYGVYSVALFWALAGGILSFLSRYGGAMTLVGIIAFVGEPYASFGSARPGLGVLLAFFGAVFTFAGVRWAIPRSFIRRQEIVGGVLYSIGFLIILSLIISSGFYGGLLSSGASQLIASAPLLLVGIFMTGLGLKLFLAPEKKKARGLLRICIARAIGRYRRRYLPVIAGYPCANGQAETRTRSHFEEQGSVSTRLSNSAKAAERISPEAGNRRLC